MVTAKHSQNTSTTWQITNKFVYAQASSEKAAKVREALNLLIMAGLLVPVTRTDASGLPLGEGADSNYQKILVFDSGILLRLLHMSLGSIQHITEEILTASKADLRRSIIRAINPQLPLFSQLYDVEITDQPLQRTEKQTLKRYLYR